MKKGIGLFHALRGIGLVLWYERNMRIHAAAVFYVSFYAAVGGVGRWGWAVLFICFGLVTGAEALNGALERLGDEISQEHRERIGAAKDMAAGAVLLCALAAVGVAAAVFGQREVWERIAASPLSLWNLLTLPVFVWFVFFPDWLDGKKGK